jgi:tetratricopeptide (TPR) repeat protein
MIFTTNKMKFNKFTIISIFFLVFGLSNANPGIVSATENTSLKTSVEIKNLGSLVLQKANQSDTTKLILKKSPKITIVVDNYEGLEPHELIKYDLDNDGKTEIIATLKYADSQNVIPFVYTLKESLEKIFPDEDSESKLLTCREVFVTTQNSKPVVCLKYLISFHDYAPPELYKLEMYSLENGKLKLNQIGYNEGSHYNLLMNLAAEYMHNGQTLQAAQLYNQAIASSTGKMSNKAFCEALFFNAEALKYSGKYSDAMKLFEKLVLEHTDSDFTEISQRELEFIHDNIKNEKLLSEYYKIQLEIVNEHTESALTHLNQLIKDNPKCSFMDRLLFTKAEMLISDNNIEAAMAIFIDIKVKYPQSPLIDTIDEMLENLESKPEDSEEL